MLVMAVVLIGGCASSGESYSRAGYNFSNMDKIAIVAIEGAIESELAKNQIADLFAMEFLKKGFAPVERDQVRILLEDKQLQASELTTEAGAAETGKILNVPAVLIVIIPHFGKEISMTAKLVDVEDGSILWLGRGSGKTGGFLGLGRLWGAGAAVSREDEELFGGVVGGVMGGAATGQPLSPKETERAQRIIKKMCATLPSRLTTEW
jgi:hypothetical protein